MIIIRAPDLRQRNHFGGDGELNQGRNWLFWPWSFVPYIFVTSLFSNAVILLLISDHLLKRLSNHFHRDKLKLNLKPKFRHCTVVRISVKIEVLYCLLQHLNDQHHHRSSWQSLCNISATCFFSRLLSIPSRMPVSANHGQIATCWAKQNLGRNPSGLFYQW